MMDEYSEEQFQKLVEQVDQLINKFIDSKYFSKLNDSQKDEAGFLIANFSEYMYRYFGLFPKNWDVAGLKECCLSILPQKVTADDDYFKAVSPVLSTFFSFLMEKSILKNGHELISAVKTLDRQILEESRNPANWGMAKSFAMAAEQSGVDLTDEEAMHEFMEFYNQELRDSNSMSISEMIDAKFNEENGELPSKMYEVYYRIPSKKVVKKKLLTNPKMVFNHSEAGVDALYLFEDITDEDTIKSAFFIAKNEMILKAQSLEELAEGKEIIEDLLGFTAQYLREEEIDLKELMIKEMTEDVIEGFLNSPLDPPEEYDGKTPLQLSKTAQGRKELERYLGGMELVRLLTDQEDVFSILNLDEIRKRLNLKESDGKVIKDGVEELLIEKMPARFKAEDVCNAVVIWRDFKDKAKEIRGWDKSWAAAVEYLINRMDYYGEYSRDEIGEDYDIGANTISNKYKEIVDILSINIYNNAMQQIFSGHLEI
jgi:hypothetical protein